MGSDRSDSEKALQKKRLSLEVMEWILGSFWAKRRVYIEWNQMICAVLLAFLVAGLYNYIGALPDDTEEFMREQAAPAKALPAIRTFAELSLLPKESVAEENAGHESKSDPKASAKEQNFAVSYGYSEPDEKKRTKNVKKAAKAGAKAIHLNVEKETDDHGKHAAGALPDTPVMDIVTRNPDIMTENLDIATGRKDQDGSIANEETGASDAETGRTDADKMNADKTDADRTEANTDQNDRKPVVLLERFPGFLTNEKGHIAGYTDASKFLKDHLVVLPRDAACTGIEKGALKGLETDIHEIYIPANISYIAEGALDELVKLYYIEAAPDNPRFYSENGVLYYRNGKVAVYPNRL